MQRRFAGEARFLTIYIKEAHPEDEWQMGTNEDEGVCYMQPTTLSERATIARDFVRDFGYSIPLLIDTMENDADNAFAGWPERLYVIDGSGVVSYKGGVGPFGFDPDELESFLEGAVGLASAESDGAADAE